MQILSGFHKFETKKKASPISFRWMATLEKLIASNSMELEMKQTIEHEWNIVN